MDESKLIKAVLILGVVGLIGYFGYNFYQSSLLKPLPMGADDDAKTGSEAKNTNPMLVAPTKVVPNTMEKSADAKELLVEGSNFKFVPNTLTVKKGEKTRILFKNSGGFHDFKIDGLNIATAVIKDGEQDFVEFTPMEAGTFEYYCSVGNHRGMGMTGTLTVE